MTSAKNQNPMQATMDSWQKMVDDQVQRIQTFYGEMARVEQQGLEQVQAAIDEMSRLMKDSLAQAARASAEWRKAALEATQQVGQTLRSQPRA